MPLGVLAQQQRKTWHIGVLFFASSNSLLSQRGVPIFRHRLHELGYVEGKTVVIDERYADANPQRLTELAHELAARKVDVIVASAVTATIAAREATSTIPIVMLHAGSPVETGLIVSLARPGGNVTGTSNLPIGGKLIDLIRELVPGIMQIAILANPANAGAAVTVEAMTEAARRANISVTVAGVTRAEDFPSAFVLIRNARPEGLLVASEPLIGEHDAKIFEFATAMRLPTIYDSAGQVRRGGLAAYATTYLEHYVLAADYVDKIIKGAKPGDLPVQQPARFELVINLKTAKAQGIGIPRSLLLRADEVIQ